MPTCYVTRPDLTFGSHMVPLLSERTEVELTAADREMWLLIQQAAIIIANAIRRRLGLPAVIVPKRERDSM